MQNLYSKTLNFLIVIAFIAGSVFSCKQKTEPIKQVKIQFNNDLTVLQNLINDSLLYHAKQKKDIALIKKHFLQCRNQYKKVEYFTEYFYYTTARLVNGAPIAEIELGENMVIPPAGFQVIEGLLYGELNNENYAKLINEVSGIHVPIKRMLMLNSELDNNDAQIFDALRLEIFRITTLGLSGFDTPASQQALPETATSLQNMATVLGFYGDIPQPLSDNINQAIAYLKHKEFNTFNQLDFITNHLQPLAISLDNYRKELKIKALTSESPLNEGVTSLFQKNAFNINSYLGMKTLYTSKNKVELGKSLFNDVLLSKDGNKSCASCHQANKAFTDGLTTAKSLTKGKNLTRNTPTLTYVGYQNAFFYDLKSSSLEDQSLAVMQNPDEMHGSIAAAVSKINKIKKYQDLVKKAYPNDTTLATAFKIENALASYVRSLGNFSSRFDKYMQGDKKQLKAAEKNGFNLFMGKGKCGSCHFAPIFNGTTPPRFLNTEAEVLGVATKPVLTNVVLDSDLGRYGLNQYDQYKYAFKTPTLRNIALTAPYMHNGVYKTLEQVIDFYNVGGGTGMGLNVPSQTLSAEKLHLSPLEKQNIIAFMRTLTDITTNKKY
jgi:cytochrome c peroxidase